MKKNQLVKQNADFHRVLMKKYPRYAQLNKVQIVDAKTGALLIPENALFVSYLISEYNQVLIFTLDTTGNLQAYDLGKIPNLDQTLKTYSELLGKQYTVKELGVVEGKYALQLDDGSFIIKDEITRKEKRQRIESLDEISRYLGKVLLEPLTKPLAGKKRLIISPDGALALIPFEALILEDNSLITTHHVSYVQSLSILALLKKREQLYQTLKNRGTLLAMGAARYEQPGQVINREICNKSQRQPQYNLETLLNRSFADPQAYQRAYKALDITWCNLPGAAKELDAVAQTFADKQPLIFKNDEATEAKLQSLNEQGILTRYRYLLLSAHGYLSMEAPALSAIVLDQLSEKTATTDGFVTASEWPSYNLQSDLMVLSACQTGVGKFLHGEGVMGLPYALYVAGNKNTLLTLWSVLDDSTAEFTASFFNKLNNGQGQIEALTKTKREFINSEKYKRPLYWAPFVLYGI
jgi:CHAT domain-containing protein